MMGQQSRTESLFYYFRLEEQIPTDHLLRMIDSHVDFSFVREELKDFYSPTGRPSIDPEVLLRLLLVGYLYGITSARRLMEEVRMHLAYRWFTRLGFEQELPEHSTFSKNRHGRFRQSGVFRKVFEKIVRCCLEAGFVDGRNVAVDGTLVGANASQQSRVPREKLVEAAQHSRTVQEYLTELERENPAVDSERSVKPQEKVSTTDPDATWAIKSGPAVLGYYDNYLVDTTSRVILAVHATPALFSQETWAARRMLEHVGQFGIHPQNLAADKAYGSGEFLSWLLARNIQPHIPVIDRQHQTRGLFTRNAFRYDPKENAYYCPEGNPLHYRGQRRSSGGDLYRSTEAQCRDCPQKKLCTTGPYRRLFVHWQEPARQVARALAETPDYRRSQRARYKIEALFAELKQQIKLRRVRLRRLWNVGEQFYLAATAQNLKRLVRHFAHKQLPEPSTT
jgi:transposase